MHSSFKIRVVWKMAAINSFQFLTKQASVTFLFCIPFLSDLWQIAQFTHRGLHFRSLVFNVAVLFNITQTFEGVFRARELKHFSRDMRFPSMWHHDKCTLRRAVQPPFKLRNSK